MMDKEHEGTRKMLSRSASAVPPPGLESRVMHTVRAITDKREKRRVALSALLRFGAIVLLSIAAVQTCLPAGAAKTFVVAVEQMAENPGQKVGWLLENVYFLLPLTALFVFSRIYRITPPSGS